MEPRRHGRLLPCAVLPLALASGCGFLYSLTTEEPALRDGATATADAAAGELPLPPDAVAADQAAPDAGLDAAERDVAAADRVLLELGEPDRSPSVDAAAADVGGGPWPPWWDRAYGYRRQLTLTAQGSDIPAGTPLRIAIDHRAWCAAGQAQAGGDDVRLVYWDGALHRELERVLAHGSGWDRDDTTLMLRARHHIAAGLPDRGYYVYHGSSSPAAPLTAGVPAARFYFVEDLAGREVSGAEGALPIATLTFTPSRSDETWLVVATWRARDTSASADKAMLGLVELRLNGSPHPSDDGVSYRQDHAAWKSLGLFFPVTGTVAEQEVTLWFQGQGSAPDAIDSVRLLAFLLPAVEPGDLVVGQASDHVEVDQTEDVVRLDLAPPREEPYLWLGCGLHHEGPGSDDSYLRAYDEQGALQQESEESYIAYDGMLVPFFHVEQRLLPAAPVSLLVQHRPASQGSERSSVASVALRSACFDRVFHTAQRDPLRSFVQTPQLAAALVTDATDLVHDTVYLAVVGLRKASDFVAVRFTTELRLDEVTLVQDEMEIQRAIYRNQLAFAAAETGLGGRTLSVYQATADPGTGAYVENTHLVALRYKEAAAGLGALQSRP